jgi:Protein of unknown function (DUF1236)
MRITFIAAAAILAVSTAGDLALAQTDGPNAAAAAANPELHLTPQQRTEIYASVTSRSPRVTAPADLHVAVDGELPPSMQLYDFPDNIAMEVPATKFYKYTIVQNEVVLVDPTKMKVVDIIRR